MVTLLCLQPVVRYSWNWESICLYGAYSKQLWNWNQNTYLESLVRYLAFGLEYVVCLKHLMRYLRGLGQNILLIWNLYSEVSLEQGPEYSFCLKPISRIWDTILFIEGL